MAARGSSLTRDLHPHRGEVRAVAYHAATRQLASSGTDGRVFYWREREEPRALPSPPTDAQDLAFAPDGAILMGSGWFNLFRWRLDDGGLQVLPTAHHGIVKSISFSRDGRTLASIGRQTDSAVYLLDARDRCRAASAFSRMNCAEASCASRPTGVTSPRLPTTRTYISGTLQHLLPERVFYLKTIRNLTA